MSEPDALEVRLTLIEGNVGMCAHVLNELVATVGHIANELRATAESPRLLHELEQLDPALLELHALTTRLVEALPPLRRLSEGMPPPAE